MLVHSEKGDGSQGRRSISSALYNRYLTAEHAVRDFNEVFGCSVRTSFHYSWLLPIPIRCSPPSSPILALTFHCCIQIPSGCVRALQGVGLLSGERDRSGARVLTAHELEYFQRASTDEAAQ